MKSPIKRVVLLIALVVVLSIPSNAGASSIGPGSQPGLAIDVGGTSYIAWNGPENPPSLQFCRLPRGATTCESRHSIAVPGSTTPRPFLFISGSRVVIVQYRYPLSGADPPAGTWAFISNDRGISFD